MLVARVVGSLVGPLHSLELSYGKDGLLLRHQLFVALHDLTWCAFMACVA